MEYEEAKQKKLEEMKKKYAEQQNTQQQEMQADVQLSTLLNQILEPEAKQRLTNIKLVNKERYLMVSQHLLYLAKAGQLPGKLSDAQLKTLLAKATQKREINITRK